MRSILPDGVSCILYRGFNTLKQGVAILTITGIFPPRSIRQQYRIVARPQIQKTIQITRCHGREGAANFRSTPGMVSQNAQMDPSIQAVIPHGSVIGLTGQTSGQWLEVIDEGVGGWVNQCWQ